MESVERHPVPVQDLHISDWPSPYRFVRCNPRFDLDETLTMLKAEVNCHPYPVQVPWLDMYYALPSYFNLQKSELYQTARIYGQDVSSGASVSALISHDHDCLSLSQTNTRSPDDDLRILDLCCCPGLKLCAIADMLYTQGKGGEIVGVDISDSRLSVCKRVLHKYQIQPSSHPNVHKNVNVRIQVFCNDGTTFASLKEEDLNLVFDSDVAYDSASQSGKRRRMNKSARARQKKQLKMSSRTYSGLVNGPDIETKELSHVQLFDRVLVDAECSTDGSVVHVQKRSCLPGQTDHEIEAVSLDPFSSKSFRWSNRGNVSELYELQKRLAASGFQLLRKGGSMIYSTCSLSEQENERVVRWLLKEFPASRIVPIDFFRASREEGRPCQSDLVCQGAIPGTIKFLPNLDSRACPIDFNRLFGGGFFLAKITKI
jgi:16S rRNA C967 or C1407 C5-methylase (RsmB/RsmF family)